jgi:hypothetical protein
VLERKDPDRGPDSDYFAHIFVFLRCIVICPLYKLTPSDQAQVTLHLRVSLADLVLRFLAGPPLLAEPKIFSPEPGPAVGGLEWKRLV